MILPLRRTGHIPKVTDNGAFHRDDFVRQLDARCAVVPGTTSSVQRGWRPKASGLSVGRIGAPGALRRLPDVPHRAAPRAYPGDPIRSHEMGHYP